MTLAVLHTAWFAYPIIAVVARGLFLAPATAGWPLVLLPLQVAFLELIIDPVGSVVSESEQVDSKSMDQLPRQPAHPMVGGPAADHRRPAGAIGLLAAL